jgi:hypothetical protein
MWSPQLATALFHALVLANGIKMPLFTEASE